ncbi:MAG TPA: TetR family transcriptional regulator [Solirubrobacteraceae bacterium]|jgi:AcrR family transcriptional regulator|nr:TetR family transcriptional regulator [Solirubrobacteraceae bacterium]
MPARTRNGVARGASAIGVRRRERGAAREVRPEGARVAEIQRSRLLAAAVRAVDELGWASTTVADVVARSRISRRTFYETFANREECLAALFEDILARVSGELARAGLEGLEWRERVRRGLWMILAFLDREPVLARVLVVQALSGGPEVLMRREEVLGRLASVVDEGRGLPRGGRCTPLTAEGVVGAAFGIVYARLLRGQRRPLTELSGELMGMIVLPYLGPGAARREQALAARGPVSSGVAQRVVSASGGVGAGALVVDPLESVPMRLTYRTSRVLDAVVELARGGGSPSNREIAERAGIQDAGQVSKLLRRLERIGLLANGGAGHAKGEPNAWGLTLQGEQVARSIRAHSRLDGGVQ